MANGVFMEKTILTKCILCGRPLRAPIGPERPLRPFDTPMCEIWFYENLCGGLDRIMEWDDYCDNGVGQIPIGGRVYYDKPGKMVFFPRMILKTPEGEMAIRFRKRDQEEKEALEHIKSKLDGMPGMPYFLTHWGR
jgi:hypothetical protein